MLFYFKSSLYLAFNDFAFFKHSFYHQRRLLQRVPYLFIFVIQENEILIAVIRDSLFFLFVNRARDPPCTTLQKQFPLSVVVFIDSLAAAVLQDAGGNAISRQNNLELHLGCHTCWLSYFTLVCLWCGRTPL